jgi:hypothetical protein
MKISLLGLQAAFSASSVLASRHEATSPETWVFTATSVKTSCFATLKPLDLFCYSLFAPSILTLFKRQQQKLLFEKRKYGDKTERMSLLAFCIYFKSFYLLMDNFYRFDISMLITKIVTVFNYI